MNQEAHNKIVSFIWSIADDCLRDVYVRGKYRDVILPKRLKAQFRDDLIETLRYDKSLSEPMELIYREFEDAKKVIKKVHKFSNKELSELLKHLKCREDELKNFGYYSVARLKPHFQI